MIGSNYSERMINMEEYEKKSLVFCFLIALIFLIAISSVSFHAKGGDPEMKSYPFPAGTTVKSLQEQMGGQGRQVIVLQSDGTLRVGGPIETGDTVEILDDSGNVVDRLRAVVEPASSSSQSSSSVPPPSSSSSSGAGSSQPFEPVPSSALSSSPFSAGRGGDYVFPGPVTVEELENQIEDKIRREGCSLDVTARTGEKRKSGPVCTGDVICVLDSAGNAESSVTAVVLGDLTCDGGDTGRDSEALYQYLTGQRELAGGMLSAADLDRNGTVDTRDLLLLKKRAARKNAG